MGIFSFTPEQHRDYLSRRPVDPATIAADAMSRLGASEDAAAAAFVRSVGPRAALQAGWCDGAGVDAVRRAVQTLVASAEIGTPEWHAENIVVAAWHLEPAAMLRRVAKEIGRSLSSRRERMATAAVQVVMRLDAAEPDGER